LAVDAVFEIVFELAAPPGDAQRGPVADVAGVLGDQEFGIGDFGVIDGAKAGRPVVVVIVVVDRALAVGAAAAGIPVCQRGQLQDIVGVDVPVQLGVGFRGMAAEERFGGRSDFIADAAVLVLGGLDREE